MALLEKRIFNKVFRGAIREIYAVGVETDTWEFKVRYLRFWREEFKEAGIYTVSQFLSSPQYPDRIKAIVTKALGEWSEKTGLEPAKDVV